MKRASSGFVALGILYLVTIPNPIFAAPPLGSVVANLLARVGVLESSVTILQTDLDTVESSITTLQSDVDSLTKAVESHGAGDVAFTWYGTDPSISSTTYYYWILKIDGTVYRNTGGAGWSYAGSSFDITTSGLTVDDLVDWTPWWFLDEDGDTWTTSGGSGWREYTP